MAFGKYHRKVESRVESIAFLQYTHTQNEHKKTYQILQIDIMRFHLGTDGSPSLN